ncbi:MAG: cysteine--tRNA ligase [Planctomycetales bacterium]|nr:cysteine--tRNA ligase [Planctomycetales bacterium]
MSTTAAKDTPTTATIPDTIRVYNTLTRSKAPLKPVKPGQIGMYLCGPTVYDKAHIGHMVGPVIFDTIKRYLAYSGYNVTWVVNITDVDDKLINKSTERGITMAELATEMTQDYLANLAGMGVDQIDRMPKATECMDEIIAFTKDLIDKGFAYEAGGDVFFEVGRDPEYGKLTNRTVDALQGEGGGAAAKKRSPADFALWKSAKTGEPSWDSPWGKGRPGWHIECSAMSRAILGETFDIHGGGLDLIFPHHENEIAQSECCHGKPMANVWMHNGLLKREAAGKVGGRNDRDDAGKADAGLTLEQINQQTDEKFSRSKGAGGLAEMISKLGGERIRFFLLRTHYRSTVVLSDEAMDEAGAALETFYRFFERLERVTGRSFYELPVLRRHNGELEPGDNALLQEASARRAKFIERMDDDFNTGAAMSELFELVRALNKFVDQQQLEDAAKRSDADVASLVRGATTLRELGAVLGLFQRPVEKSGGGDDALVGELMSLIIDIRNNARANKDFATSDKIRDKLNELQITLEDRKDGTGWRIG